MVDSRLIDNYTETNKETFDAFVETLDKDKYGAEFLGGTGYVEDLLYWVIRSDNFWEQFAICGSMYDIEEDRDRYFVFEGGEGKQMFCPI